MSLYNKILTKSVNTAWQNKYLWFFGFFAAFLGTGASYKTMAEALSGDAGRSFFTGFGRLMTTGVFGLGFFKNIFIMAREDFFSFIVILILFLIIIALIALFIWLAVVSQSALVNNSSKYLSGGKSDFNEGMKVGIKKFWPVFGLNVLIKIISSFLVVCVGTMMLYGMLSFGSFFNGLVYIMSFVVLMLVIIFFAFIIKYAIAYVVIKENNIVESLKKGWQLFSDNWLISIEMSITLFAIEFLVGIATILVILILGIPWFFLSMAVLKITSVFGFWIIAGLGFIVLVALMVAIGSFMSVFQISAWTGLFVELNGKGGTSKLARIAADLMKKK